MKVGDRTIEIEFVSGEYVATVHEHGHTVRLAGCSNDYNAEQWGRRVEFAVDTRSKRR